MMAKLHGGDECIFMRREERYKIGIYCPGDGKSGPWRYVHSILRAIDLNEFDVRVFCDIRGHYPARPEIRVRSLSLPLTMHVSAPDARFAKPHRVAASARVVWRATVPPAVRLWSGFNRQAARLADAFRRDPVDLLHTNNTGCEESAVAARRAGIRRVLGTFHVDSTYDLHRHRSGWGYRALEHLSNHSLTNAIGVSRRTSEDWIRRTHLPRSRVVTIHNGIDPRLFARRTDRETARRKLGLPNDERVIVGGVGRLEEAKGFEYLIGAIANLAPRNPELMLVLAGQGVARERLAAQAERLGIADRVRFLGFCPEVQIVFDALDIFAMPSLCEALPYALLEAMATGLPAVGATVGGIPEVIVEGATGLLVPPRSEGALAAALQTLIDSPGLRAHMGTAARERVEKHFTEAEMVAKTIDLYRVVLGDRRKRGEA